MSTRSYIVAAFVVLFVAGFSTISSCSADSAYLYGIHWWGYTQGQPIDNSPANLLDAPQYGGWDVECAMTHSDSWWSASYFVPLYQDLANNRNMTIITRVDYQWGQTVPSPSNPDYAGWPGSVVGVVNTLKNYSHIWVLGNEPNLTIEGNGWPSNHVTPEGYATIYRNVRSAVHNSAQSSPLGEHIVLIAAVSPGPVAGDRWMAGNDWLSQVIDNIPNDEIDGFAIHAYGNAGLGEFQTQYRSQLSVIDGKGLTDTPVYMTEWERYATPGSAAEEAVAAQFCRDSLADVNSWNQTSGNHNVICMCWFVFDRDQQSGGNWDRSSIEYWRDNGNPPGHAGDLYTAFAQTVDLRYPAGSAGGGGGGGGGDMIDGVPAGTNLAPSSSQVAADSENSPGEAASEAIDGVVSAGDKWTSAGTSPPHWLKLDLGGDRTVNGFIVRHAGAGGEPSYYNTQQFSIQSSSSYNGPWVDETSVDNSAQLSVTNRKYVTPKTLRYVRLHITDPGIDNYARIPEFEVIGEPPGGTPLPTYTPTWAPPVNTPTPTPVVVSTPVVTNPSFESSIGSEWQKWVGSGSNQDNNERDYLGGNARDGVWVLAVKGIGSGGKGAYQYISSGWMAGRNYRLSVWAKNISNSNMNYSIGYKLGNGGSAGASATYGNTVVHPSSWTQATVEFTYSGSSGATVYLRVVNDGHSERAGFDLVQIADLGPSGPTATFTPTFTPGPATATPTPHAGPIVEEDFETMPSWTSSYDASWGSAAVWSIQGGGQSGNYLQAYRNSGGSSAKVNVYTVPQNTDIEISIYMRCPSMSNYWMETAYRLGNHSAQDFDSNSGAWTMVKKFSSSGTNGNGNVWTYYSAEVNTGSNTQISVGFKLGSSGTGTSDVGWDTLRIEEDDPYAMGPVPLRGSNFYFAVAGVGS